MYTSHRTRIECRGNGSFSQWFQVHNGVKQAGVLSPVLFCVYMDGLLTRLKSAGFGCYIGHMFSGVIAYADDIALLAPTVREPCDGC